MELIELNRPAPPSEAQPALSTPGPASRPAAEAAAMLSAGREAIRRAMSNDSERFMRQMRQQSGQ